MASFALRDPRVFAYEWASLDVISRPHGPVRLFRRRRRAGGTRRRPRWHPTGRAPQTDDREYRSPASPVAPTTYHFRGRSQLRPVTMLPKPLQSPCPIWLTTNAARPESKQTIGRHRICAARVGRVADGWMTHSVTPEGFRKSWDLILNVGAQNGRDMSGFDNVVYHHININDDRVGELRQLRRNSSICITARITPKSGSKSG